MTSQDRHRDLDAARTQGDPPADAAAAHFAAAIEARRQSASPPGLIESLQACFDESIERPACLTDWMAESEPLPDWADPQLIREGQMVFQQWALQIFAALYAAWLPYAYAASNGAQILAKGSDLVQQNRVARRLVETAVMLIDVHDTLPPPAGVFAPGSQATTTLRNVRLLHGCIRHKVTGLTDWDDAWGMPVNQEDLVGTQLTFTTVVFNALHRLGVRLSDRDKTAYLHLWAVIGAQLGVARAGEVRSLEDANELHAAIVERHHRPSVQGTALMAALLAEAERAMPRGLAKVPRTLVRRAAGPVVADLLDVPKSAWWGPALVPLAAVGGLVTPIPGVRRLSGFPMRFLSAAMLRRLWDEALELERPRFRMTDDQARQWRLHGHRSTWRAAHRQRRLAVRLANTEPNTSNPAGSLGAFSSST